MSDKKNMTTTDKHKHHELFLAAFTIQVADLIHYSSHDFITLGRNEEAELFGKIGLILRSYAIDNERLFYTVEQLSKVSKTVEELLKEMDIQVVKGISDMNVIMLVDLVSRIQGEHSIKKGLRSTRMVWQKLLSKK